MIQHSENADQKCHDVIFIVRELGIETDEVMTLYLTAILIRTETFVKYTRVAIIVSCNYCFSKIFI